MEIDEIIDERLNAIEETLKQSMELISDAYSQCNLITYLKLLKQNKNSEYTAKSPTVPKI